MADLSLTDSSQIFGKVGRSRSVGLRCLKVRFDNFQTNLWRCGTWPSPLYLSRIATTSFNTVMKSEFWMLQYFCNSEMNPIKAVVLLGFSAHWSWNSVHRRAKASSQGRNLLVLRAGQVEWRHRYARKMLWLGLHFSQEGINIGHCGVKHIWWQVIPDFETAEDMSWAIPHARGDSAGRRGRESPSPPSNCLFPVQQRVQLTQKWMNLHNYLK